MTIVEKFEWYKDRSVQDALFNSPWKKYNSQVDKASDCFHKLDIEYHDWVATPCESNRLDKHWRFFEIPDSLVASDYERTLDLRILKALEKAGIFHFIGSKPYSYTSYDPFPGGFKTIFVTEITYTEKIVPFTASLKTKAQKPTIEKLESLISGHFGVAHEEFFYPLQQTIPRAWALEFQDAPHNIRMKASTRRNIIVLLAAKNGLLNASYEPAPPLSISELEREITRTMKPNNWLYLYFNHVVRNETSVEPSRTDLIKALAKHFKITEASPRSVVSKDFYESLKNSPPIEFGHYD